MGDDLQVEWQAKEEEVQVRLTAVMAEDQYVAFGLSPVSERAEMLNSDLVVAYYDSTDGSFHAIDYTVTAKSECDGKQGVCPDEKVNGRNDASVIGGERKNGITSITFSRPYQTNDHMDLPILRYSGAITVLAAIGHLNNRKEADYHEDFVTKDNVILDFSSVGDNTCKQRSGNLGQKPRRYEAWAPRILRAVTNFTATIGPTGGERGYSATTKTSSWGIAWWINDKLIPEIFVERGQTYHFTVYGGNNRLNQARYHPLYITNSSVGGFSDKTHAEQQKERIFAGVSYSKMGMPEPTAVGSLCEWRHNGQDAWRISRTFEEYAMTLYPDCHDSHTPGFLVWTVTQDTPDLVYYQCYNHPNMGWKIHVVNNGYKSKREGGNGGGLPSRPPHPLTTGLLLLLLLHLSPLFFLPTLR
ncbi:hypothetical protein Pcinc_005655 [Petrolisthes cinctipes]|uniref:DOMON domain-containing protein n=1 Tax=Petrolisthes cinctipes TaxID=88211 RepID=A0AAE1GER4_PETCI|nr:hypothetical protein Pcinc_005655 [Petrolisthes cinctipes]